MCAFCSLLSYFTDLSYIGLCAYFWAAGVQSLFYVLRKERSFPLQRWPRPLQFLHLLLFSTITSFRASSTSNSLPPTDRNYSFVSVAILVTIVFWAVLSSKSTFATAFSGSRHGRGDQIPCRVVVRTNVANVQDSQKSGRNCDNPQSQFI